MISPWTKMPLELCNGTFTNIINNHQGGCIKNTLTLLRNPYFTIRVTKRRI